MMMGYDYDYQETKLGAQDLSLAAHLHPDPVVLELNRLQNQLKEKDRELGAAQGEIKGLRANEALKDKAIEELRAEANKLDEKLRANENLLEQKNLDIKRLRSERRDALAAQYAAESTLRRVYTDQKDEDSLPLDSILAPLEAEIKMYKNEITALQEDKKALERLTKSKESALLEAERILRSALERALIVEEVQNQNYELRRQIEICQEENKILEKTNRQKVLEVEKLSETIKELEEAVLAGAAAANIIRDHRRQISELQEEKRTLERELARVKVSAGRIANVVANEWKDENDKVMPVRQWLEERRLLQAEMQRLKDKLAISERTAKAEAQLKDKLKLRLKTLEEGLKQASSFAGNGQKTEKSGNIFGFLNTSNGLKKRSTSQPRGASINGSSLLQQPNIKSGKLNGENVLKKGIWAYRNKVADSEGKENAEAKANADTDTTISNEIKSKSEENEVSQNQGMARQVDEGEATQSLLSDQKRKILYRSTSAPLPSDHFFSPDPNSTGSSCRPHQNKIVFRQVLVMLFSYLGFGTLCFYVVRHQIEGVKTNGILDAIYFCVVTMTTVGYGDLVPRSNLAKLLSCIYVFTGMALGGMILGEAADYLLEKQEILLARTVQMYEKMSSDEILKEVETHKVKYKFLMAAVILLVLVIAGIVFLATVENFRFVDAFYCVCSTITTLGYGDKSFSTEAGRVFAVFWIICSTICLAQFFLYLAEMYTERRQRAFVKWILSRRLTYSDLEAADLNHDKAVSAA